MVSIKKIREDIRGLRGTEVSIFGQPTKLSDSVDNGVIDILDVLESLERYEITNFSYDEYDEETDEYIEKKFDSVDDYINYLDDLGDIDEVTLDNSYNWSSPVSNDFNFRIYKNFTNAKYFVELSVHRYGDVRANYTVDALLEFDYSEEFYEVLTESNKIVELDEQHYAKIDIFNDGYEIFTDDGEYVETVYDLEDFNKVK